MTAITSYFKHSFTHKGMQLVATIPLYCFIYNRHIDAVDIKGEDGASVRLKADFDITIDQALVATWAESQDLPVITCACGTRSICQKSSGRTGTMCEDCEIKAINAEFAQLQKAEDAKEARKDVNMFKKGYRFKFVAWVHPGRGDDYQIAGYAITKPSDQEMQTILRKKRSQSLNDFTITELKAA